MFTYNSENCLSFSIFSVHVKWHAEYGCDLKILKTFPIKQTWPSSLSVEVIGFPRYYGPKQEVRESRTSDFCAQFKYMSFIYS